MGGKHTETPLLPLPVSLSQRMCRHQEATLNSGFWDWFKQRKSYSQASAKSIIRPELNFLLNFLALLEEVYFVCLIVLKLFCFVLFKWVSARSDFS